LDHPLPRNYAALPDNLPGNVFLDRPRVHAILRQALRIAPIAVLAAGTGCGKTQAAYSFLRREGYTIVWLNLSESDNIPQHFWETLLLSAERVSVPLAEALRASGFPTNALARNQYIENLAMHLSPALRYAIVFDNFQEIHNPDVLRFLEFCVPHTLNDSRALICSHTRPLIENAPFLPKQPYAIITSEDLAFTEEEFFALFGAKCHGFSLSTMMEFYLMTGGWPFAVGILSAAAKARRLSRHAILQTTKREIFGFIEHALFDVLPLPIQKALIALALTPSLPFSYLVLLEQCFIGMNLKALPQLEMFIHTDAENNIYYIHPLLLEFLGEKKALLDEAERRDILETAAQWSLDNGLLLDAGAYWFNTHAFGRIVDLILRPELAQSADISTFFLSQIEGITLAPGEEHDDGYIALRYIFLPRFLLDLQRYAACLQQIDAAIARFAGSGAYAEPFVLFASHITRAYALMELGVRDHRYPFAQEFHQAYAAFLKLPEGFSLHLGRYGEILLRHHVCLVGVGAEAGAFDAYVEAMRDSVATIARMHLRPSPLFGRDLLAACECAYYQGQIDQAESLAWQAIDSAMAYEQYETAIRGGHYLLRTMLSRGNGKGLERLVRWAAGLRNDPRFLTRHLRCDLLDGELFARIGLAQRVPGWIQVGFGDAEMNSNAAESMRDVRFGYYFVQGRYAEALRLAITPDNPAGTLLIEALNNAIGAAMVLFRMKNSVSAAEYLTRAYRIAKPHGFVMPFIEYGSAMRAMLTALMPMLGGEIPADWLRTVQQKASAYAKMQRMAAEVLLAGLGLRRPTQLSERERDMLLALNNGLTRSEIAAKHYISVNTVKSTLQSVYTKLDAKNSTQAVRIAREQCLL
jgi:LuxR family maltose regulon positive regulatory protein